MLCVVLFGFGGRYQDCSSVVAVSMKVLQTANIAVSWDVTPCSSVGGTTNSQICCFVGCDAV